jgi:hypothetical protein
MNHDINYLAYYIYSNPSNQPSSSSSSSSSSCMGAHAAITLEKVRLAAALSVFCTAVLASRAAGIETTRL